MKINLAYGLSNKMNINVKVKDRLRYFTVDYPDTPTPPQFKEKVGYLYLCPRSIDTNTHMIYNIKDLMEIFDTETKINMTYMQTKKFMKNHMKSISLITQCTFLSELHLRISINQFAVNGHVKMKHRKSII